MGLSEQAALFQLPPQQKGQSDPAGLSGPPTLLSAAVILLRGRHGRRKPNSISAVQLGQADGERLHFCREQNNKPAVAERFKESGYGLKVCVLILRCSGEKQGVDM